MNQEEANQTILKLMNNLYQEEIELFKESMFQCDLKIQGKYGRTPLIYALYFNQSHNLNLSEEQWDYLIKNSDLSQKDFYGDTTLMYVFINNKEENLNLNQKQINYLIKNSDLTQQNNNGWTILMYAFAFNKTQNLNLRKKQIDYLIKNSDLKQQNNGRTPLMVALRNNNEQNLKLTKTQFQTMYDALNEEQKQITFKKLIKENVESNHNYVEEINLLLYNCEFQPNQETINWLKENHQDILEIIEKRDLFFQLNKEVKEMNHHQKIAIIKL